jgi:hypothetical protein
MFNAAAAGHMAQSFQRLEFGTNAFVHRTTSILWYTAGRSS